jgi:1-acyl-sn-glycerol-3-phosphate acyltransferase
LRPELDPGYRALCAAKLDRVLGYFDPEVRGLSNLPAQGPYLLVGNHSGGLNTPDALVFETAYLRHWGMDKPLRPLAHNLLFSVPSVRRTLQRLGALPACPENAAQALERGEPVLVYPGGDYESQRPFYQSKRVDFGGRQGFIRLALEKRVPVFPVVCHGANETVITLTRGEWLAKISGLASLTRTKVLPMRLSVPFGVLPAFVPHVPLPSKITIEVGQAMKWQDFAPIDARNPALLRALYEDIVGVMQRTLDGLYEERPNPYRARIKRQVNSLHCPVPMLPQKALALRVRDVPKEIELAAYRPPALRPALAAQR